MASDDLPIPHIKITTLPPGNELTQLSPIHLHGLTYSNADSGEGLQSAQMPDDSGCRSP